MKYYHIVLIFLIGIILSFTSFDIISGQDQFKKSIQWKNYTDPEGKLNLQYPSDWNIEPKKNRFDTKDLELSKEGSILGRIATVIIISDKNFDMSEGTVKEFTQLYADVQKNEIPSYRIIEDDIDKYQIDGNEASGYIFGQNSDDGVKLGGLQLVSFPNNNLFGFMYMARQNDFDRFLPTVEKIIESIKLLD